jgi:hypothetical protein
VCASEVADEASIAANETLGGKLDVVDVSYLSSTKPQPISSRWREASSRPEEDEVVKIPLRLRRHPFFPEDVLPQLFYCHDLLPAISNLARVLQDAFKPIRRSGNFVAVHCSVFLVTRQYLPQEHFRFGVLVQSVQVEGEPVELSAVR